MIKDVKKTYYQLFMYLAIPSFEGVMGVVDIRVIFSGVSVILNIISLALSRRPPPSPTLFKQCSISRELLK